MSPASIYMAQVGALIPAIMKQRWQSIANIVRWTESTSVDDLQRFVEELPGKPVPPTGDEMLDRYIVLSDDEQKHLVIGVPIELKRSDLIWLAAFNLDNEDNPTANFPVWNIGLNEQRLVTEAELDEIRERCGANTPT